MDSLVSFEGLPVTRRTRIEFETPTPRQPGAFFERDLDRETVMRVSHGEQIASLPVESMVNASEVKRSLKELEMIAVVELGLSYQPRLAEGDKVPSELISGAPSWTVPEKVRSRSSPN